MITDEMIGQAVDAATKAIDEAFGPQHRPPATVLGVIASAVLEVVYCPDPHLYLSTGCLHDTEEGHAFCRVEARRYDGTTKTAGVCKFCDSKCVCSCHGWGDCK